MVFPFSRHSRAKSWRTLPNDEPIALVRLKASYKLLWTAPEQAVTRLRSAVLCGQMARQPQILRGQAKLLAATMPTMHETREFSPRG